MVYLSLPKSIDDIICTLAMRCADCNGCQIGDECVGYDPSGTYGPPDEKTCRIHGVDCSGVPDDSSNIWIIFKPLVREWIPLIR